MSDFNISIISNILDKNNIETTHQNNYLFLMFFLQRCQLVSNLIKLINNKQENTLSLGIKYVIMNETKYENIKKKINDFKKDFEKSDLINEILDFIKKTIDNPNLKKEETSIVKKSDTKPLFFKTRLQTVLTDFKNINTSLDIIDNSLVLEENDLSSFLSGDDKMYIKEDVIKRLDRDITKLELNWIKYKKNPVNNKEMYLLLKNWFNL